VSTFGLPEAFFDVAMFWETWYDPANRSEGRRVVQSGSITPQKFPIWHGRINMSPTFTYDYRWITLNHTPYPLIRWYKKNTQTQELSPVSNL